MKLKKKEMGITLIVLVVTIIVLLILAGVVLRIVAGEQGILKRTEDAVTKNDKGTAIEELELAIADLKVKYWEDGAVGSLQDYVINALDKYEEIGGKLLGTLSIEPTGKLSYETETTVIGWIDEKGNLQIGEKNMEPPTIPEGLEIGSTVSYNPSGTYNWQAEYCSSNKTVETDDVELNSGTGESFNISSWRVFNIDRATGKIEMVPAGPTSGEVYLGESQGYNNGVKLLNDACNSLYSDSSKGITARSINREDIEKRIEKEKLATIKAGYSHTNLSSYAHLNENDQVSNAYEKDASKYPLIYGKEALSVIDGNPNADGLEMSEQKVLIGRTEADANGKVASNR